MPRSSSSSRKGLFSKVYSPLHHLLSATRNVSRAVFKRTGKVVEQGVGLVDNTGSAIARHADMTVSNVTGRKTSRQVRKVSRKASRKVSRKASRQVRKASRKNRK
jgi:hypothetical protein